MLSSWGLGHLIESHGRRATVASGFGSFAGPANFRSHASALLERDPAALQRTLADLGVGCVVVTPRMVSELASLARIAEWPDERRRTLFEGRGGGKRYSKVALESALVRLALHGQAPGEPGFAGLELLFASPRYEYPDGRRAAKRSPGSGPVLSIYRVLPEDGHPEPGTGGQRRPSIERAPPTRR